MGDGLNSIIYLIVGLLALVILAQVFFFQVKEKKINNIILGFTEWMKAQDKINNALTAAIIEIDMELVKLGVFSRSMVADYIVEKKEVK